MFNVFDYPELLTGITVFGLIVWAISSYFLMKIFEKAGVQGAWRAWVPVYNLMEFSKLGDLSPWLVLVSIAASILLGNVAVLGRLRRPVLPSVTRRRPHHVRKTRRPDPASVAQAPY